LTVVQSSFTLEPTFFHREEWLSLLQKSYGYQRYDISSDTWTTPLLKVEGIFGKRLISTPFSDYGGPIGEVNANELTDLAKDVLERTSCEYLELRVSDHNLKSALNSLGFCDLAQYATHLFDAQEGGIEWLWQNSLSKTARRYVRKAQKEGIEITEVTTNSEWECAYQAYFKAVKQLGSPCHSRNFFFALRELRPLSHAYLASCNGKNIGTAVFLTGNQSLHLWLIYCLKEYKKLGAIYLLDWVGITLAHNLGLKYFDFGRTRIGSGVELYKHHWKGKDKQIYHIALFKKRRSSPDPSQLKFRMSSILWRFLPDSVIARLGPKIIRSIAL